MYIYKYELNMLYTAVNFSVTMCLWFIKGGSGYGVYRHFQRYFSISWFIRTKFIIACEVCIMT